MLEHARILGISTGPIFLHGGKCACDRATISRMIAQLAEDIGMEPGKANPRNPRRLHLNTQAEFQKQVRFWVIEQYTKLLAEEEDPIVQRVCVKDE